MAELPKMQYAVNIDVEIVSAESIRKEERERLIKLLEDFPHPHWAPEKYIDYVEAYHSGWESAIAYIQGEAIEDVRAEAEWYYKMKEQEEIIKGEQE